MSYVKFTKQAMKNLFSKPATTSYPAKPKVFFPKVRGHVEIDLPKCIFCGICSKKCPTGAITVDRAAKSWAIKRFSCIQCSYCTEVCPKKCLSMGESYTAPGADQSLETHVMPAEEPKPALSEEKVVSEEKALSEK